jgi:ABC-type spermidine/putrescine transport system permease subunit II
MLPFFVFSAPRAEILFMSLYVVGFVAPMAFVMILSFFVSKEWPVYSELYRPKLLKWTQSRYKSMLSYQGLWDTLFVVFIAVVFSTVGCHRLANLVVAHVFLYAVWLHIWNYVYPESRVIDLLLDYDYRLRYPQLRDVTDGFGT